MARGVPCPLNFRSSCWVRDPFPPLMSLGPGGGRSHIHLQMGTTATVHGHTLSSGAGLPAEGGAAEWLLLYSLRHASQPGPQCAHGDAGTLTAALKVAGRLRLVSDACVLWIVATAMEVAPPPAPPHPAPLQEQPGQPWIQPPLAVTAAGPAAPPASRIHSQCQVPALSRLCAM